MKTVSITEFADHKDTENRIKSISDSLNEFGLLLKPNPMCEGSDNFSFIIMKQDYDREELFDLLKGEVACNYDDPEEDDEDDVNRDTESYFKEITGEDYYKD